MTFVTVAPLGPEWLLISTNCLWVKFRPLRTPPHGHLVSSHLSEAGRRKRSSPPRVSARWRRRGAQATVIQVQEQPVITQAAFTELQPWKMRTNGRRATQLYTWGIGDESMDELPRPGWLFRLKQRSRLWSFSSHWLWGATQETPSPISNPTDSQICRYRSILGGSNLTTSTRFLWDPSLLCAHTKAPCRTVQRTGWHQGSVAKATRKPRCTVAAVHSYPSRQTAPPLTPHHRAVGLMCLFFHSLSISLIHNNDLLYFLREPFVCHCKSIWRLQRGTQSLCTLHD